MAGQPAKPSQKGLVGEKRNRLPPPPPEGRILGEVDAG